MPETGIKLNSNNEPRYDWRVNHEAIRQSILTTLKSEKRFPTYKEISVETGLSVNTICEHAKALDMKEMRTQARLLGPDILLRQAVAALQSGDHNEAKTYFKLNFDWAERSDVNLSGGITVESPEEQRAKLEARKREILSGERKVEIRDAEFIDIQESKSGEFEASVNNSPHTETE